MLMELLLWSLLLVRIPKNDIMCFIDYRIYRTPSSISYKESIKKDIINKEYVF